MVPLRRLCALLAAACAISLGAAEIGIGDKREDVLKLFGKPTSIARRGDHEIFMYPRGGRIEFVDGRVADVKGPLPTPIALPAAAEPPAPEPLPAPSPGPDLPKPSNLPPLNLPAHLTGAGKAATAPATGTPNADLTPDDYNPAAAANELAKHVEKMDTPWGASPLPTKEHSPLDSLPTFVAGLLLRFGFTLIALKVAFKFWEMDAFWKGIFIIAGIDLVLHAIFELLGPATQGFTTMKPVENGIPGLVMIYTVHRFCFSKRLQKAVLTAAAVKFVVTFLYLFAGLALLNLLFG